MPGQKTRKASTPRKSSRSSSSRRREEKTRAEHKEEEELVLEPAVEEDNDDDEEEFLTFSSLRAAATSVGADSSDEAASEPPGFYTADFDSEEEQEAPLRKKSRKQQAPDAEELALHGLLFPSLVAAGPSSDSSEPSSSSSSSASKKPSAWIDPDTERLEIELHQKTLTKGSFKKHKLRRTEDETSVSGDQFEERLRMQFQLVHSKADTSWADVAADGRDSDDDRSDGSDDDDDDNDNDNEENAERLLRSTSRRTRGAASGGPLPPSQLSIVARVDLNKRHAAFSPVESVRFHPGGQLAMVASQDSAVRIFSVDGKNNPKVQGVVLRDLPLTSAEFTGDGKEIVCTGKRKYFYSYSLESGHVQRIDNIRGCPDRALGRLVASPDNKYLAVLGEQGAIHILSRHTKASIALLKMNGEVSDAQFFCNDGAAYLYSVGKEGDVYVWDMNTRRCVRVFADDGSIDTTAVAVSSRFVATGSKNGFINVYDVKSSLSETPTLVKSFKNFTTPVSLLRFNHDAQILAGASRPTGFRLFHCSSLTAFANWPSERSPLEKVTSVDFSPHSGFLSIGNERGRALLYRLHHFDTA